VLINSRVVELSYFYFFYFYFFLSVKGTS